MHSGSHARTYTAASALPPRRFVKFTADKTVGLATSATDDIIGVTADVGAEAPGDLVDVYRSGPANVDFGGNVGRGKEVVSDANGKAVQAAPAAGTICRVGGLAEQSHVAGDIGLIEIGIATKTAPAA
ncbi:hypothetical protein D3C71_314540 [compost metagenome]